MDNSKYTISDSRPLVATSDVATVGLPVGNLGGFLIIVGTFAGTLTFTSDPGTGTYATQSLTAVNGTTGSTVTGGIQPHVSFLIPAGLVGLKVTATAITAGNVVVYWKVNGYNSPIESRSDDEQVIRRTRVMNNALGYYHETYLKNTTANSSALATGVVYATSIGFLAGDTISNLGCYVATAGNTLTLVKMGVTDKNGKLLCVSTDVKADMLATGPKTVPMTSTFTIPSDDLYYVVALQVGTTGPALIRTLSFGAATTMFSSTFGACGFVAAQADLVLGTTYTILYTGATVTLPLWFAIGA